MEINEISVPLLGGAAGDYLKGSEKITSCFDYALQENVFQRRLEDLQGRTYPRRELVSHLLRYNERFGASSKTIDHIHALEKEDTLVVIGGQQAGVLTGPLYTIHKIISIIQLAKKQTQKLGVRVVPVFWIAGEDHDIDEINHVHVMRNGQIRKSVLPQLNVKKASASETPLNYDLCVTWVESVFKTFQETNHTKQLLQLVKDCLKRSETYTDFFAYIITELFKEEGLILVDSGSPELRKLEASFFSVIIERHEGIQKALLQQQTELQNIGYNPMITTKPEAVHLFMNVEGERWLLEKDGSIFICKNGEVSFTLEELLRVAEEAPERLSNNVVTRPLMQDYLFPTLAFIGGPGEVAYWAELQKVFHEVEFTMPPVIPRLMITYVERHIEADLQDMFLTVEEALTTNISKIREKWLSQQITEPIADAFEKARNEIEQIHASLREMAERMSPALGAFAEKNKFKIEEQLLVLERAIQRDIETKHSVSLNKFRRIEHALHPMGLLQERVWNVFYYMNEFGLAFIHELLRLEFTWNETHKIVKL
jgi:bacillithiol biosynthesis cysteine-adding enzyme BshC